MLTNLPPCHGACHSVCRWRRVRKPHLTQNAAVDTEPDGAGRDAGKRTGRFLGGAVISIAGDALALVMLLVCDAPALTPVTDCPVSCPTELADYKGSQLQQEFDLEGYTAGGGSYNTRSGRLALGLILGTDAQVEHIQSKRTHSVER